MNSTTARFIFLGTGTSQGIPVIGSKDPVCLSKDYKDKRFRSSAFIEIDNLSILIDCGPDFRLQMLTNNLSKLNAILFTHEHNDHVIGLDDVRPIFFQQHKNIDLYGKERVLNEIRNRFPYAFSEDKYPGVPEFEIHPVHRAPFFVENLEITPVPVLHGELPILGYKIKNLAYITDASKIPDESLTDLENLDVLIINALRKEPKHYSHFVLEEALEIIEKLSPKKAYITHISHKLGFHEEVQKELPENVLLAFDGLDFPF